MVGHVKAIYVANLHVTGGASIEEVMEQYNLSRAQVYAALAYYYDNEETIKQFLRDVDTYVEENIISSEDRRKEIRSRQHNAMKE